MGQGYSLTTLSAGSAGIDVPELSDLAWERALGDARFMKAVRARHRDGLVVTKVVMKPYASMKFEKYIRDITRERKILASIPNTLSYQRAFETSSNGYLVRQYVYSSVYDRMSTRPFLEDIEKRWLAFQLLNAIKECHSSNVFHGDIKTENTLVTSWNWLFLSDFSASFKPTYLPEDNPADFSFFFDISGRRTCYLAPERFISPGEPVDGRGGVTWAMDIFSVGCVIAELFLESPIFNLSQLFHYRTGDFNPHDVHLNRLEDKDLRELIAHMIQLEPESRYSADEYLNFWRQKSFPEYFYGFLHQYMYLITDPSSGRAAITSDGVNFGESDDRIARIYQDFDKISYFLGYSDEVENGHFANRAVSQNGVFPFHLDVARRRQVAPRRQRSLADDGTFLFLSVVTSSLRSTARASARIQACELLLAFAEHIPDEAKLDRILPFVMSLIDDKSETVKVTALRTLAQLVALVDKSSPVNAYIFPEYIIPKMLEVFTTKKGSRASVWLRIAHAQCLSPLAETASRFLDTVQALKAEGSLPSSDSTYESGAIVQAYQDTYDLAHADLLRFFESQTKALLTDQDSNVRRTFLGSVAPLCVFFGSAKASDVILSHLNTYLNDKDWKLKCSFFDAIVGVATYVGSSNLEEFILPLMIPALSDPEEFVVERVIRSFSALARLGLLQRSTTWDLVDLVVRFTMHPNAWIREGAADFVSSSTSFVSAADCQCIIVPRLAPYVKSKPSICSKLSVLDCLKRPLPRNVFDLAVSWAAKSSDSTFWKPVQKRRLSSKPDGQISALLPRPLVPSAFAKFPKNGEDHKWITRVRDAGMTFEDEFKLLALIDYIWLTAKRKSSEEPDPQLQRLSQLLKLSELRVPLNNVTFENQRQVIRDEPARIAADRPTLGKAQTIADALLDASTNIGEASTSGSSIGPNSPIKVPSRVTSLSVKDTSPRVSSPLSISPLQNTPAPDSEIQQMHRPGDAGLPTEERKSKVASKLAFRPKESAIDLMPGRDSSAKAIAETSTSSANAIGNVDSTQIQDQSSKTAVALAQEEKQSRPSDVKYKGEGGYNYSGRDPNVLRLLDSLYIENYPLDTIEFGPIVTPVQSVSGQHNEGTNKNWRPQGTMIAMFSEHTGPVTKVQVSPDHLFFITGSDDGTVRVWDTGRLERNVAHRSRQTYRHAAGTRITSLCFIENTHCFVSTASDGSVHVVKVDCTETSQGTTKYGKLKILRQWHIPHNSQADSPTIDPGDPSQSSEKQPIAVCTTQHKSDPHSLLHIATNMSRIYALDLRTMNTLYTLQNPVHHGTPTTFCLGSNKLGAHHWLLLGTSHGVCDLWDLRFRLRLRSFAFPGSSPIEHIVLHPNRGSSKTRVVLAGGTGKGDVTVWDLEKLACREVYRTSAAGTAYSEDDETADGPGEVDDIKKKSPKRPNAAATAAAAANAVAPSLKPYTLWFPDSSPRSTWISRFGNPFTEESTTKKEQDASSNNANSNPDPGNMVSHIAKSTHQVRAIVASSRTSAQNGATESDTAQDRHCYLISAGGGPGDTRVRFWDMQRIENSCVISGLVSAGKRADKPRQPSYGHVGPIGRAAECVVYEEHEAREESVGGKETHGRSGSGGGGGNLLNEQQQRLLRSHSDTVLDVAVVERPCWMVVSVDRSGTVFVFS